VTRPTTPHPAPLTVADWQRAYADGASPALLLGRLRERLAAQGAPVFLHVATPSALQGQLVALAARAAALPDDDARRATLPLYGVPFVVKDNIDIAGEPTTAACPAYTRTASHTATAVQRLLDAGAVWLAKTNLDQFATGLVGTRSPYGAPASAWSAVHVSGGSSSGSAVAVAAGLVPLALGTDTAGSGRIPAGFNHIVGLKPTPGRVSTAGVLPACRTLDCVSIFALTVEDAALALAVVEGADAADDYSCFVPGPAALGGDGTAALTLGVPATLPPAVDAASAAAFERALAMLRSLGHVVRPLDLGVLDEVAALLYSGPWVAERHAVVRDLLAAQPQALDATVRRVIEAAAAYSATDAFEAQYRLRALARRADALLAGCDGLLVPTAPHHPTLAQVAADPVGANAALGCFTNFVNLLGWCALALPASVRDDGLPFGVTFIARGGRDAALARLGCTWQAAVRQPLGATGVVRAGEAPMPHGPVPATEAVLPIAVVGAHLTGLPLNHQLTERGATLLQRTHTAPLYRLYELPGSSPRKPGLLRVVEGGVAVEVEVWALPAAAVGSFLALVPSPLGIGTLQLADGQCVHGFLCEPCALAGARDVSAFGGWRAYLSTL
jgi:allophanate hydrolase